MSAHPPLERRIARVFAVTLLILYAVVATAIWATSRTEGRQTAVLTLENEAEGIANFVAITGRIDAPELAEPELEPFPIWVRLFDGDRLVAATPGAPELPWAPPTSTEEVLYLRVPGASKPHLVVRHEVAHHGGARHQRVTALEAIGDITMLRTLERRLVQGLTALGLVIIPAAAWGGRLMARRALAPMAKLVEEIRALEPERLDGRLKVRPRTVAEVELLASTFNDVLARLERSVGAMRRFTGDASHEIRNPLAVMRTGIEVTLRRERSPDEYRVLLRENLDEIERLQATLEGLLAIARGERAQGLSGAPSPVDLGDLVRETASRFATAAAERGNEVRVEAEPSLVVAGDARLLRLVPFNLLDNALKHSPAGAPIEVEVARRGAAAVIAVADRGPGVPAAERERIFERYVRLDGDGKGVGGVGLSVVRWVAEAHGGSVTVVDGGAGARFEVSLPCAET